MATMLIHHPWSSESLMVVIATCGGFHATPRSDMGYLPLACSIARVSCRYCEVEQPPAGSMQGRHAGATSPIATNK